MCQAICEFVAEYSKRSQNLSLFVQNRVNLIKFKQIQANSTPRPPPPGLPPPVCLPAWLQNCQPLPNSVRQRLSIPPPWSKGGAFIMQPRVSCKCTFHLRQHIANLLALLDLRHTHAIHSALDTGTRLSLRLTVAHASK